jgi:hypothetical protein
MIDEAVGLFAVPPTEFVAERKRLAAALKAAGRAEDAAVVARLKRPKLSEYALNRMAHDNAPVMEQLVTAIRAASDAQSAAIGGDPSTLRDATATLRAATSAAVDAAVRVLDGDDANGEGQRDEIAAVVRSFVSSGDTEPLRLGVVGASAVDAGGDLFAGAPDPPPASNTTRTPRTVRTPVADRHPPPTGPSPADRARKMQLERQLRDAQGQVDRAERAVAEAAEQLTKAQQTLDDRRRVLDERRATVDTAERALAAYRTQWPAG